MIYKEIKCLRVNKFGGTNVAQCEVNTGTFRTVYDEGIDDYVEVFDREHVKNVQITLNQDPLKVGNENVLIDTMKHYINNIDDTVAEVVPAWKL